MTKELYDRLKEYDNLLYTASERNYVMFGSLLSKQKLSELYTEIFNKKSNMLSGCGSCALKEMQALAKAYYDEQKQFEIQDTIQEENKPKRGRKKKEE